MSNRIKRGLCWALTTLQVTSGDGKNEVVNAELIQHKRSVDVNNQKEDGENIRPMLSKRDIADHCDRENVRPVFSRLDIADHCDRENVRPVFSRLDIADHCDSSSCWMVINNKVYDVTRFLRIHPGGDDIMLEYGGHDATSAFIDKGHSLDAHEMLSEYCIGEVTKADRFPEKNIT